MQVFDIRDTFGDDSFSRSYTRLFIYFVLFLLS
jgi:hypothetical protein